MIADSGPPVPTFVYRIYNALDVVMYIGCSIRPDERIIDHRRKTWGRHIARVETVEYPSRPEALAAERAEIERLKPPYNVFGTGRISLNMRRAARRRRRSLKASA